VATDHTTTTLVADRDLTFTSAGANEYDRRYVYLEAIGEWSRITRGGLAAATGTLTLSPAVTDAPTKVTGSAAGVSTDATSLTDTGESMTVDEWVGYTVWAGGQTLDVTSNTATKLTGTAWSGGSTGPGAVAWTVGTRFVITKQRPPVLQDAIDAVQRNTYVPCFFPLSMHIVQNDCNDMEASTVATDWDVAGISAAANMRRSRLTLGFTKTSLSMRPSCATAT
jgi:hypothetical protein